MDPAWTAPALGRRRANSTTAPARPPMFLSHSYSAHDLPGQVKTSKSLNSEEEKEANYPKKLQKQSSATSSLNPRRPPRNPARTPKQKRGMAFIRPSTSTGVPDPANSQWEQPRKPSLDFTPSPPSISHPSLSIPNSPNLSSNMSAGSPQLLNREDITPWEFPSSGEDGPTIEHIPLPDEFVPSTSENPERQAITPWEFVQPTDATPKASRSSTTTRPGSISSNLNFSDIPLVRRRKSVDRQQVPRSRSTFLPSRIQRSTSGGQVPPRPVSSYYNTSQEPIPPLPSSPTTSQSHHNLRQSASSQQSVEDPLAKAKFSTADRTILQELKRSIDARDSEFLKKGTYSFSPSIHHFHGKKHHPFSPKDVPYPRYYERDVLDMDTWESLFVQQLCGSLTFHKFDTPPAKILDLGCGTGIWTLDCARAWKNSEFIGLDVVPLHPDLFKVGSSDLANRITWVQANFLDGLPFPNDEFDFVHIKRIALGVPEHKWDFLMEEITRVMKPGAAFEMIEEDLFFPGKPAEESDEEESSDSDTLSDLEEHIPKNGAHSDFADESHHHLNENGEDMQDSPLPPPTDDASTPSTSILVFPLTPRSTSPVPVQAIIVADDDRYTEATLTKTDIVASGVPEFPAKSTFSQRTTSTASNKSKVISRQGSKSTLHSAPPSSFKTSRSGQSSVGKLSTGSSTSLHTGEHREGSSSLSDIHGGHRGHSSSTLLIVPSERGDDLLAGHLSLNMRTVPKPPMNPRDHELLETIWKEMNADRFVNLSPLSLLANSIGLYFKGVKTHPPLQLTFPPHVSRKPDLPTSTSTAAAADESNQSSQAEDNSSRRRTSRPLSTSATSEMSEADRVITEKGLMQHASPYAALDDSRSIGLSPTAKSSFPLPLNTSRLNDISSGRTLVPNPAAIDGVSPLSSSAATPRDSEMAKHLRELLPHGVINLDLRTLNLHLHARTAEIIGCAEAMWEWVTLYVEGTRLRKRSSVVQQHPKMAMNGVSSASAGPIHHVAGFHQRLIDLTRKDFDALLARFEMDMQDQCAIHASMEHWFNWRAITTEQLIERDEFDAACERWDQWEATQQPHTKRHRTSHSISSLSSTPEEEHMRKGGEKLTRSVSRKSERSSANRSRSGSTSMDSTHSSRPPSARLSRSLRVFVAWKP